MCRSRQRNKAKPNKTRSFCFPVSSPATESTTRCRPKQERARPLGFPLVKERFGLSSAQHSPRNCSSERGPRRGHRNDLLAEERAERGSAPATLLPAGAQLAPGAPGKELWRITPGPGEGWRRRRDVLQPRFPAVLPAPLERARPRDSASPQYPRTSLWGLHPLMGERPASTEEFEACFRVFSNA